MVGDQKQSTNEVQTILDRALINTEAFALDWHSKNIYFSTSLVEHLDAMSLKMSNIFISNFEGAYVSPLIPNNPGVIKGIVVVATEGLIYWNDESDIGNETVKVAQIDGTRVEELEGISFNNKEWDVTGNKNIRCLSYYDTNTYSGPKLFWINEIRNLIQYYNFNTKTIRSISTLHKFDILGSLTVHMNNIYFTEHYGHGKQSTIKKLEIKHMEKDLLRSTYLRNISNDVFSLKVYDSNLQNDANLWMNSCSNGNGGCDHICIAMKNETRVCKCTIGYALDFDQSSCKENPSDLN